MSTSRPVGVATDRAPAAIGAYSQAVRSGDWLFCSGQIGLDPATGELVEGGVEVETRRVLANLSAVLEAGGCGWPDVVRATIYLVSIDDFARVNEIYAAVVGPSRPARAAVGVAALPRGARVEIDAIARIP